MRRFRTAVAVGLVTVWGAWSGQAMAEQSGSVALQVDTGGNPAAAGTPVSGGVPFPMGAVSTVSHLRLKTAQGSEVPANYKLLASWPDGSIKSVLVSFVPTPQSDTYGGLALDYGPGVTHSTSGPVQVSQDAQTLTVTTGLMKLQFSKARFTVLEQAWTDLNGDGTFSSGEQWLTGPADLAVVDKKTGRTFRSSVWGAGDGYAPQLVEVGPQKVTLLLQGRLKGAGGAVTSDGDATLAAAKVWLSVYAGSSVVHLQTTVIDDKARPGTSFSKVMELDSVVLEVPTAVSSGTYAAGGESGVHQGSVGSEAHLLQDAASNFNGSFSYDFSYNGVGSGGKAPGWMDVSAGGRGIAMGIRHFWQSFPRKLAATGGGLMRLEFLPADGSTDFWTVYPGVAKTHEAFLDLHAGSYSTTVQRRAALLLAPALLKADPAWYGQTEAFGPLAPPSSLTSGFEAKMARQYDCTVRRTGCSIYPQIYGQRDFGDYQLGSGTRSDGTRFPEYGDGHYEDAHGILLQYVRTGNRGWFDYAVGNARHHYDLDVMHTTNAKYPGRPAGMIHWHGTSEHEGSGIELGHVVPGGLDEYYLLTGDPRALDVIREQGDWVEYWARSGGGRIAPEKSSDSVGLDEYERVGAWTLYTVLKAYEATGDPKYWEGASILVKNTIDWWKMPQDHIVFDPSRTLDLSKPPQGQALYYQRSDWTQGTGYPLPTLRVANCSNSKAAYTNYPYQTHAPIAWMNALMQTTIIRYYQALEDRGGTYAGNVTYRGSSTPINIDLATLREMLIQMTNMVVNHDYMGAPEYPSKYPWLSHLEYNQFVYSACPERDPRVFNGDQYFPWVLSFVSSFDQSQVSSRWQGQWAALQAKWRKIAQLQYKSRYITETSALTGYNGVQIIWNMPYGLKLMEQLGLLNSLPSVPPPSSDDGGSGGGSTGGGSTGGGTTTTGSSLPAYRATINDGNPFITDPLVDVSLAAPSTAAEVNLSPSGFGQGTWQAMEATVHGFSLPAGSGSKTLYVQFRDSGGTVLASLTTSVVLVEPGVTGTMELVLSDAADTHVFSNSAGTNYGSKSFVAAGLYSTGYDYIALFDFGVPALPAGLSATVTGARLELYLTENTRNTSQDLTPFQPTEAWNEDTVTWNARPALSTTALGGAVRFTNRTEINRWKTFALHPAAVQAWLQDPASSHGIALKGEGVPGQTSVQFTPSEGIGTTTDHRPRLIVTLNLSATDTTPPSVTDVQLLNVGETSVTFQWTTNEPTSAAVDYGLTTDYDQQVVQSALSTTHAITLTDLSGQTTYHGRLQSTDAAGNTTVSEDQVFTTTGARPGDLNGDGVLTIEDVTALVGQLLGLADVTPALSDVNADGRVDVGDVQALVNLL